MPFTIAIAGPTASGKSSLAMQFCERYNGELVSFDSMQIYKTMDIGTAKPTKEEQLKVVHHMIDICEPNENFSTADFVSRARLEVDDIYSKGKNAVLCGGTGLYLDSFINERDFGNSGADFSLRSELESYAINHGNHALHQMLEELDPIAAEAIHENNVKRVIRAIEICKTTGMTKTEWDKKADSNVKKDVPKIILDFHNRDLLYERINLRVDEMVRQGLVEETRCLMESGALSNNTTASQAIGYKEIVPYLKGIVSLEEAVETLKLATRHYAKRQQTWLRKSDGIRFYVDDYSSKEELFSHAEKTMGEILNVHQ